MSSFTKRGKAFPECSSNFSRVETKSRRPRGTLAAVKHFAANGAVGVRRRVTAAFIALFCGAAFSCAPSRTQNDLKQGIELYRSSEFTASASAFEKVAAEDPPMAKGWLYLGAAYAQQFIPGAPSDENLQFAKKANDAFERVLQVEPANKIALAAVGNIAFWTHDYKKAEEFERKRIEADPQNPDPYYFVGVLDWTTAFTRSMELRRKLGLPPDQKIPLPEKARAELEAQNSQVVEQGLQTLSKAIQLRINDSDTMAYLNLMYRQKAELERDAAARAADLKTAEEWNDKAMAALREASTSAAPQNEEDRDFSFLLVTPPPPPPPPPPTRPPAR